MVGKKLGEIHLHIDYHKFHHSKRCSSITPKDEALQAFHSSNWFTSFHLAQGYLQLVMEEDDIKKTAFRARSSGLYEFTHVPFGLLNASSSFCCLMDQCLGDQQFVTLLLYLWWYLYFSLSIEVMLDWIELVFNRLIEYHFKIKPKKCHFFETSVLFLGHILSSRGISANPEKVEKLRDGPIPTNAKDIHSFLGLDSYYQRFIPKFAQIFWCLHELVGPTSTKTKKIKGQKKEKTDHYKYPDWDKSS